MWLYYQQPNYNRARTQTLHDLVKRRDKHYGHTKIIKSLWGINQPHGGTIPQLVEGIYFPQRPDPDAYYNYYSTIIEGGQKGQQRDHVFSRNLNARACVDILPLHTPIYLHTPSYELF